MRFDEIDWRRKVWTIPGDRTKSRRKHIVPLIDLSLAILEKMERRRDDGVPYVFAKGDPLTGAGPGGKPLTNSCVRNRLKRISGDDGITIHSFRRGLGSWADTSSFSWPAAPYTVNTTKTSEERYSVTPSAMGSITSTARMHVLKHPVAYS
jgi:integrase